jgi:DNA-binding CsgD family transcriptional regulator
LYEDMGSFQKAYTLLHKFHTMEDSLNTEKIKKETIALKEKYESEKKSNEINILKTEGLKNQIIILALGLLALALIIFIQWNRNKNKQAKLKLADEEKERKYLKKIVESREKELTAQIAQIVQLEDDIKTMHEELVSIIDNSSEGVEKLKHQLKSQLIDKNEFVKINEGFEDRITEFNQDYFKLLLSKYPELTLAELKLCAYLRLGLSTKEIAQLLNRSIRTIESSRTDIRKKIKLASEENLTTHLIALTD